MNLDITNRILEILDSVGIKESEEIIHLFEPCVKIAIQKSATTYVLLKLFLEELKVEKRKLNKILNECENILFSVNKKVIVDQSSQIPVDIFTLFKKNGIDLLDLLDSVEITIDDYDIKTQINNFINNKWMKEETKDYKRSTSSKLGSSDLGTTIIGDDKLKRQLEMIHFQQTKNVNIMDKKLEERDALITNILNNINSVYGVKMDDRVKNFFVNLKLNKISSKIETTIYYILCICVYYYIDSIELIRIFNDIFNLSTIKTAANFRIIKDFYDYKTYQVSKTVKEKMKKIIEDMPPDNDITIRIKDNWKEYLIYHINGEKYIKILEEKGINEDILNKLRLSLENTEYDIEGFFEKKLKQYNQFTSGVNKNNLNEYFKYTQSMNLKRRQAKKPGQIAHDEEEEEEDETDFDKVMKMLNR